jgi:hypothetical protein
VVAWVVVWGEVDRGLAVESLNRLLMHVLADNEGNTHRMRKNSVDDGRVITFVLYRPVLSNPSQKYTFPVPILHPPHPEE